MKKQSGCVRRQPARRWYRGWNHWRIDQGVVHGPVIRLPGASGIHHYGNFSLDPPSLPVVRQSLQKGIEMKKISLAVIVLLVALGLILSACASQAASGSLPGTSWKLVSYGPAGNQTLAASGIDTNLDFGTDGTVNGNLGCNSFLGNFQVTNGNIVFTMMISTMMACPGPGFTQERVGLKIMNGTVRYSVAGNKLTMVAASGDNVITFSK
jgi:heat shock protein HslJ